MKYEDIKDMSADELEKNASQVQAELFELKMKHALGQISNPLQIRDKRRAFARIKTAMNSKKVNS